MSVLSLEDREFIVGCQNEDSDKLDKEELHERNTELEEILNKLPQTVSAKQEEEEKEEVRVTIEAIDNLSDSGDEDLAEQDAADREFDKQAAYLMDTGHARITVEDLLND
tara:strand:+ start:125 stop:454 length:330 start_codon:yes stop_codon:yes gene_type:complete